MPNGPRDVAISGHTSVGTVEQQDLLVRKEDHNAECAALGQGIIIVPGRRHVWDDVDTRRVGWVLCDCPVFDPLVGFEVAATTEQDRRYVVVRRGEGKHHSASRGWVGSDRMGDIRQGVFDVVLIVEYLRAPVGLDEEISRGEKPGEREKVGGEGGGENIQPDGLASGGEEFVSGVVLTSGVDETGAIRQSIKQGI